MRVLLNILLPAIWITFFCCLDVRYLCFPSKDFILHLFPFNSPEKPIQLDSVQKSPQRDLYPLNFLLFVTRKPSCSAASREHRSLTSAIFELFIRIRYQLNVLIVVRISARRKEKKIRLGKLEGKSTMFDLKCLHYTCSVHEKIYEATEYAYFIK